MNEIEQMRDGMDRAEKNLIRFRWIITNPRRMMRALERILGGASAPQPAADAVVKAIDDERNRGS